jgi:hypothetical protein
LAKESHAGTRWCRRSFWVSGPIRCRIQTSKKQASGKKASREKEETVAAIESNRDPLYPEEAHASLAAARLLREVADYERRLRRLNTHDTDQRNAYLVEAYRRALQLRRSLIADLPQPRERAPDPWRATR